MKILITAFEPFNQEKVNPALEAVRQLDPAMIKADLIKLEVPTAFNQAIERVEAVIQSEQPDIVVAIGQAGGRYGITPERVAINLDDALIKDNLGQQPIDQPIQKDGPAAYFSTLPIKAIVHQLRAAGIPASISNSAGTFVCNHLMYGILDILAQSYPEARGGFIHVPYIPEQVVQKSNQPSMALDDITRGLVIALNTIIHYQTDLNLVGGTIA